MAAIRDWISESLVKGLSYVQDEISEFTGQTMLETDRFEQLLEAQRSEYALRRDLELLGWTALDASTGNMHELKQTTRLEWVKAGTYAWMNDPMAGSAIDLLNDFTFGRGVPRPRARMQSLQVIFDAFWDDPDNQAALTSYSAQVALGTDLQLQSNLFLLVFDDGEDGTVKLTTLDHDTVLDAVRDPENRLRVLYYVATERRVEWDFDTDQVKPIANSDLGKPKKRYYAHWRNVRDAEQDYEDGKRAAPPPKPPADKLGEGRVYHIAVNRKSEQVFGVPTLRRTLRWFSAYNDFMSARVDMAKAAAALVMRRKVKGAPTALSKLASQAVARGGEFATLPNPTGIGPGPAGVVQESENVTHEKFNLDSGASGATQDATMLRSQVSAGTRFPQHYLGDQGNANLATATAMDLPVTKMVESRQELFEQMIRAVLDIVIERAIEKGKIKVPPDAETDVEALVDLKNVQEAGAANGKPSGQVDDKEAGTEDAIEPDDGADMKVKSDDAEKFDLTYEFKMPNPLRRLVTDLATVIQTVARTFDPNNTNVELARTLLTIMLGEGLEMQDPADAVERIFPEGYQDPLVQQQLEAGPPGAPGAPGDQAGGQQAPGADGGLTLADVLKGGTPAAGGEPGSGRRGPYGTKSGAVSEARIAEIIRAVMDEIEETRWRDLPQETRDDAERRLRETTDEFDSTVGSAAEDVVASLNGAS